MVLFHYDPGFLDKLRVRGGGLTPHIWAMDKDSINIA
jgi:hypothetical protein